MMMRKIFTLTTVLSTAMILTACGRTSLPTTYNTLPKTVRSQVASNQTQLIVRFKKNVSRMALQNFNQKYQLRTVSFQPQLDAFIMELKAPVASQAALQTMVNHMQQEPVALMVEVNHEIQVAPVPYDMTTMPVFGE